MYPLLKTTASTVNTISRFYSIVPKFVPRVDFEEIHIPFEWGSVRGKLWGVQTKKPILSLHGWQDNCGTFDTLIPYLNSDVSFLAIDLPGHGRSSHYPKGIPSGEDFNYLVLIRRIQKMLDWPKVALMGHSMGAIVSTYFAMHYPKEVDFLICFDGFTPHRLQDGITQTAEAIDKFLKYEYMLKMYKEPVYSMEELQDRLIKGTGESVDYDKCSYLIERNVSINNYDPYLYAFSRDVRVKTGPLTWIPEEDILKMAPHLTMPICLFKAKHNSLLDQVRIKKEFDKVWAIVTKNRNAECIVVDGTHHVHLNNPKKIAEKVNEFLDKFYEPDYLTSHLERYIC